MKLASLLGLLRNVEIINLTAEALGNEVRNVSYWSSGSEVWGNGTVLFIEIENLDQINNTNITIKNISALAIYTHGQKALATNDPIIARFISEGLPIIVLPVEIGFASLADMVRRYRFPMCSVSGESAWWYDELLAY